MSGTAIVILNFNGASYLRQFLPSVVQYSPGAEIIVADNASTDDSVSVLYNEFPSVRIIRLDRNYGFCGGYNRALGQVTANYVVLLNSDVQVTPGWLQPMQAVLDRDAAIAAVQPKVLSWKNRGEFEYACAGGGFIDSLGYPFCRGRVFSRVEPDHGQYDDELPIFWSTGACMMMRLSLYREMGGLDEDFFAHMEEIDLCWKLHRAGHEVYYTGRSTVYHVGAGTLGYLSPTKTYLNFRNGLALITKHFDPSEIVLKLPARVVLDWVASASFLLKGQPSHSLAVLRAHVHYAKQLQKTLQKRKEIRLKHPNYPRKTIYKGLILLWWLRSGNTQATPAVQ